MSSSRLGDLDPKNKIQFPELVAMANTNVSSLEIELIISNQIPDPARKYITKWGHNASDIGNRYRNFILVKYPLFIAIVEKWFLLIDKLVVGLNKKQT